MDIMHRQLFALMSANGCVGKKLHGRLTTRRSHSCMLPMAMHNLFSQNLISAGLPAFRGEAFPNVKDTLKVIVKTLF